MSSLEQHSSASEVGCTLREIKDIARDLDPTSEAMKAVWDQRGRADKRLAEKGTIVIL